MERGACLRQVRRQAVVWSSFNGQADALGAALLAEADSLSRAGGAVARQRIMQVAHKVVSIVQGQGHERAPHQDELNLHT